MTIRETLNVLFVCSMNQWRSPTAEKLYSDYPGVHARSCGTNRKASRCVTQAQIAWADVVFVMEKKHLSRLRQAFPTEMLQKEAHILHIPDEYRFMDKELVSELQAAIDPVLADKQS